MTLWSFVSPCNVDILTLDQSYHPSCCWAPVGFECKFESPSVVLDSLAGSASHGCYMWTAYWALMLNTQRLCAPHYVWSEAIQQAIQPLELYSAPCKGRMWGWRGGGKQVGLNGVQAWMSLLWARAPIIQQLLCGPQQPSHYMEVPLQTDRKTDILMLTDTHWQHGRQADVFFSADIFLFLDFLKEFWMVKSKFSILATCRPKALVMRYNFSLQWSSPTITHLWLRIVLPSLVSYLYLSLTEGERDMGWSCW